ncbi:MAG: cytochrome c family protein [Desulfobacterales bacterium]|nr:cytochrome c family protein [Desulfobacterales bacterium]
MKIKQNSGQKLISNRSLLLTSLTLLLVLGAHLQSWGNGQNGETFYVGSSACRDCHPEEYENFMTYAKKSTSFQSIEKQMKHLTPDEIKQCYPCHTTGYGKAGGFISLEETPHLKNAGCEVCHGPGSEHARTADSTAIIVNMGKKDCEVCHISERVKAFKYKPLIHGGAH